MYYKSITRTRQLEEAGVRVGTSVSDVLTCTRVHVDVTGAQPAAPGATPGATQGCRQTWHPRRHARGHALWQAASRKLLKFVAPAAPSSM
jgi:hypothetical protein